ncbi:MAG TPA: hypothetical protein VMA77_22320 [Solirubrobacteraceae bacterium]|nr:hypothetical protein [Solirubrobacteraceae bacterium]
MNSAQSALHAAADAHAAACAQLELAQRDAEAAWDRLQASPDTIEYQIDWNLARRHEAAALAKVTEAERRYIRAGGYALTDPEE